MQSGKEREAARALAIVRRACLHTNRLPFESIDILGLAQTGKSSIQAGDLPDFFGRLPAPNTRNGLIFFHTLVEGLFRYSITRG